MTFVITQPCLDTKDQSCVEVCPVDCIHFEETADRMLYINPLECIDCGACQPACPVTAIFPDGDVPAEQQRFIAINSQWYEDPDAARGAAASIPALDGATAAASGDEAPAAAAPAAASPAAPAAARPAAPARATTTAAPKEDVGAYKYGENGVEGKCSLCGTYVIKGGTKFRTKSVLCPECAGRQASIGNPYQRTADRR